MGLLNLTQIAQSTGLSEEDITEAQNKIDEKTQKQ
jgi:hypothetical protein